MTETAATPASPARVCLPGLIGIITSPEATFEQRRRRTRGRSASCSWLRSSLRSAPALPQFTETRPAGRARHAGASRSSGSPGSRSTTSSTRSMESIEQVRPRSSALVGTFVIAADRRAALRGASSWALFNVIAGRHGVLQAGAGGRRRTRRSSARSARCSARRSSCIKGTVTMSAARSISAPWCRCSRKARRLATLPRHDQRLQHLGHRS